MPQHLAAAIDTVQRHAMAAPAPQLAPAVDVNGGALGALILGIILCTMIVVKWRNSVYKDSEKKAIMITALAVALLAGSASGLVATAFSTVQQTGNSVGNSLTQTTLGR
ncbi:hypothetical protein ABZY44_13625 [Streptomyces sp. NPDC006544]|uniref:hypothetical protein n=1 Tax=Streptomyces sp. NPDC006544 TaxID=3154583 RepID=UPI0033BADADA